MSTLLSNTIKPRRGNTVTFTDNVSIGGTVTYEDVSNVDSVGIITSQSGIKVGAGQSISPESGTIAYYGDGSNLTGIEFGTRNFVASGTLPNGTPVIIKDDGTVGIITQTTSDTQSAGDPVSFFPTGEAYGISSTYDSNSNRIVIGYTHPVGGGGAQRSSVIVGEVSGETITFGTPVEYISGNYGSSTSLTFDSNKNKVVIAYYEYGVDGKAIVGTVDPSDNSISFGSTVAYNTGNTSDISATYGSTSERVVIAYTDHTNNGYGTAIVGEVTVGSGITFGPPAVYESTNMVSSKVAYDTSNDKAVISYKTFSPAPATGTAIVGVVTASDNSISFPSPSVQFFHGNFVNNESTYDSTSERVAIVYQDTNNNWYGTAIVGEVTGTGITFGSSVVFNSASSPSPSIISDSIFGKVVISYQDQGNTNSSNSGTAIVGVVTASDNSISFPSSSVAFDTNSDLIASAYDSTNGKVVISYRNINVHPNIGKSSVFSPGTQTTNLTAENYIGISGESISNGATGKINITGGINSGQTGLTTAQKYYVGQTGILTTTADTPSVVAGTSISDTKIVIK